MTAPPALAESERPVEAPRLLTAGVALDRFADSDLLAAGKITIVALDAVVARFGRRWDLRRDQVYDHVERTFERALGSESYCQRVSDTDYLICQPTLSRAAGQVSCFRCLREILMHFLGDAREADRSVLNVTKISRTAIEAAVVDIAHAEREGVAELDVAELESAPGKLSGEVTPVKFDEGEAVLTSSGREIRFSAALEPVFELKTYRRIGFRLARRVSDAITGEELPPESVRRLPRADIINIDLATIARGLHRLRAEASDEQHLTMIIPVSYLSASHERTRQQLIEALAEIRTHVSCGVICQLCDIDGAPPEMVRAAVSMIRPHALFVMADLAIAGRLAASSAAGCGFQAMSARCPAGLDDDALAVWAHETVASAKPVAKSVLACGVQSLRRAAILGMSGVSHASLRAQDA